MEFNCHVIRGKLNLRAQVALFVNYDDTSITVNMVAITILCLCVIAEQSCDLQQLSDCCHSCQGCFLLLLLKQHLKKSYGLSDRLIQYYYYPMDCLLMKVQLNYLSLPIASARSILPLSPTRPTTKWPIVRESWCLTLSKWWTW